MQDPGDPQSNICPVCARKSLSVEKRRQNTNYLDDELNFIVSCLPCWVVNEEYWKEQWDELHRNVM